MKSILAILALAVPAAALAQLSVTVSPVKVTGQKAIVPLALKNGLAEKVDSARASLFLLDGQGKMVAQATRWIIGDSANKPGLAAGASNAYHFVITSDKPFTATNLTAKVVVGRVVMNGGKLANPAKDVIVTTAAK